MIYQVLAKCIIDVSLYIRYRTFEVILWSTVIQYCNSTSTGQYWTLVLNHQPCGLLGKLQDQLVIVVCLVLILNKQQY